MRSFPSSDHTAIETTPIGWLEEDPDIGIARGAGRHARHLARKRTRSELQRIIFASAPVLLLFGMLDLTFNILHSSFPYLESGADIVTRSKHSLSRNGQPFKTAGLHVMIFGNSKVLSGFIPSVFDHEMAVRGIPAVESYNFGLPGDARFVDDLTTLVNRGVAPDVVLLTSPWPAAMEPRATLFHFVRNDGDIVNRLFPFRTLCRDFFILATESKSRPVAARRLYLENERTIRQVESDRGYYFIVRQSHFPNHSLPQGLGEPTDSPRDENSRVFPRGASLDQLSKMFAAHKIKCLLIPSYFRRGQFAQPGSVNVAAARMVLDQPDFDVCGPDYYLYPNPLFSDFTHTNPRGAQVYTRDVAALVAASLREYRLNLKDRQR